MRTFITTLALAGYFSMGVTGCGVTEEIGRTRIVDGFQAPESAIYDPATRAWYVSNVSGYQPGDGFISRVSFDGDILDLKFVSGLNDPKGLRVHDGRLYAADVQNLVVVDLANPAAPQRIEVSDALMLNDVAIDPVSDDVYVSDTFADAIYRFRGDRYEKLFQSSELQAPNGISFGSNSLFIASIGPDIDPATFAAQGPGKISRLDLESLELSAVTGEIGALDGLEQERNTLLVSEFYTGVYRVLPNGSRRLILANADYGLASSADIGFDPSSRRLAVPELAGTRVGFFDLELSLSPHAN